MTIHTVLLILASMFLYKVFFSLPYQYNLIKKNNKERKEELEKILKNKNKK